MWDNINTEKQNIYLVGGVFNCLCLLAKIGSLTNARATQRKFKIKAISLP